MKDQAHKLRKLVRKSLIVSFTSGKGGVGKTNIAINLAVQLVKDGMKVLLLDGDLSLANVDLLFGVTPKYNIKDAIFGDKKLNEIIIDSPYGVKIIPASSGVEELADLPDDKRKSFIDTFKEIEGQFDFIFIDTAAGVSKNVTHFLLASDEAIIITTPELTALADAYAVIKILSMNKSLSDVKVLVNLAKNKAEAEETIERIKLVASKFLGVEVKDFGFIYQDPSVGKAVVQQSPFVISFPYSRASTCMKAIANKMRELKSEEPKGKESLFERIVEATERIKEGKKVMRKKDLIANIALTTGLTKKKSKEVLDRIALFITEALANHEPVKLQRFGVFEIKTRGKRKYYHPKLRKFIESPARNIPRFRASKVLAKKVQNA